MGASRGVPGNSLIRGSGGCIPPYIPGFRHFIPIYRNSAKPPFCHFNFFRHLPAIWAFLGHIGGKSTNLGLFLIYTILRAFRGFYDGRSREGIYTFYPIYTTIYHYLGGIGGYITAFDYLWGIYRVYEAI